MAPDRDRTVWQSIVWHAPGFVIGLYFLSLQFVATINLSYLVLLAGAVFLLLAQPIIAWRSLFTVPTALAVAILVSTILSAALAGSTGANSLLAISLIPGLLIYAIVVLCVCDARQLLFVAVAFLAASCATAWTFLQASIDSDSSRAVQLIYFRSHPLFLAANDVLMYVIFLPLVVWLTRRWPGRTGPLLAGFYMVVVGGLSLLLLSRLSLLILAACCVSYLGVTRQRRFWYALAIIAALVAVFLLFDASFAKKLQTLDLARLRTWIAATAMFADSPWFGNGPGSFSTLYPAYLHHMPDSLRFGREIRSIGWAHSLFFEAAAERGAIGLAIFSAYFLYLFAVLKKKLHAGPDDFLRALRMTTLICFVAALFELSMLRVWGVFAIYLLLALAAVFTREGVATEQERANAETQLS